MKHAASAALHVKSEFYDLDMMSGSSKPKPAEFEDRPAIGDDPASEITWRSVALRFAVAFGILAALLAIAGGLAFLREAWQGGSRKAEAATAFVESPTQHWNRIPDIWSLRIAADDAVTLSSERTFLHHVLARGGEFIHTGYINGDTGEMVNAPLPGPSHGRRQDDSETEAGKYANTPEDDALHLTIKVGESCLISGLHEGENYRLLRIVHGNCVFERSGWNNERRSFQMTIVVKPYPAAD